MFNIPMHIKPMKRLEELEHEMGNNVRGAQRLESLANKPTTHVQLPNSSPPSLHNQHIVSQRTMQVGGHSLIRGQKTSLSKLNPNLDQIEVFLCWNAPHYDLDTEAFMLAHNDKVVGDDWFVFYNQPTSPDHALQHIDNPALGQCQSIKVTLSMLNPEVEKIIFVLTIQEAKEKKYNFSGVSDAFLSIVDIATKKELIRFNLTEYYDTISSMMVGELYKKSGEWRFNPIANGTADDLLGLCIRYGVNVS